LSSGSAADEGAREPADGRELDFFLASVDDRRARIRQIYMPNGGSG